MLRRLDHFELVILDDIGYVNQSADEAEVLFTLLAERYERRSTALSSNLDDAVAPTRNGRMRFFAPLFTASAGA